MFKKFQALGKAIKSVTPNVPTTKKEKLLRDLKITKQKVKGATAKLKQTQFERANPQKRFSTGKELEQQEYFNKGKRREKKMGGGMMGRRFGMKSGTPFKKKTNVEKIKETFGVKKKDNKQRMQAKNGSKKKFPDLTGDGKVTQADILKGRGVFKKGGGVKQMVKTITSPITHLRNKLKSRKFGQGKEKGKK